MLLCGCERNLVRAAFSVELTPFAASLLNVRFGLDRSSITAASAFGSNEPLAPDRSEWLWA